jgi:hypothetical protein
MKKYLFFILAISLLSVLVCGCDFNMVRYQNKKYAFSLLLPRGWQVEEGTMGLVLSARAPQVSVPFVTNLTLTIGDLSAAEAKLGRPITLTEFYEINKAQIMQILPGVEYNIQEGYIFAGRHRGTALSFNSKLENLNLKFLVGVWLIKSHAYTISCSSTTENFSKYLPVFKKVMQSLRVM